MTAAYRKSEMDITVNVLSLKRSREKKKKSEKRVTFNMPEHFGLVTVPMHTASTKQFGKNKNKKKTSVYYLYLYTYFV